MTIVLTSLLMTAGLILATWAMLTPDAARAAPRPGRRRVGVVAQITRWQRRAGFTELSTTRLLLFLGQAAAVTGGGAYLLTSWLPLAVIGSLVGPTVLLFALARRAAARDRQMRLDLEKAVDTIRSLISSHLSVPAAVSTMATNGPDSLREAFRIATITASASTFPHGIATLRTTIGPAAEDLVLALSLASSVGAGRLPLILDRLELGLRNERETIQAATDRQYATFLQAYILAFLPGIMLVLLRVVNPRFASFYDTPLGGIGLVVIGGLVVGGLITMTMVSRVRGVVRPTMPSADVDQGSAA